MLIFVFLRKDAGCACTEARAFLHWHSYAIHPESSWNTGALSATGGDYVSAQSYQAQRSRLVSTAQGGFRGDVEGADAGNCAQGDGGDGGFRSESCEAGGEEPVSNLSGHAVQS